MRGISSRKLRLFLWVGVMASAMTLASEWILGAGKKAAADSALVGLFTTAADRSYDQIAMAGILGVVGAALTVLGYYAIYKMIRPMEEKTSKWFVAGLFGCTAWGSSLHISVAASDMAYKWLSENNAKEAVGLTGSFAHYMVMLSFVLFAVSFGIVLVLQIVSFLKGSTPYASVAAVYNAAVGAAAALLISLLPLGDEFSAGLVLSCISIGNLWTFAMLLLRMPDYLGRKSRLPGASELNDIRRR